jgi:hypothetical protein
MESDRLERRKSTIVSSLNGTSVEASARKYQRRSSTDDDSTDVDVPRHVYEVSETTEAVVAQTTCQSNALPFEEVQSPHSVPQDDFVMPGYRSPTSLNLNPLQR